MPLGNGDISLNAWIAANGDLVFYIGKSDSWGDNARLLKVGRVRIGWYHHNTRSIGPALSANLQGLDGFDRLDPVMPCTFGGVIHGKNAEKVSDRRLAESAETTHHFTILVITQHPSTPDQWLAAADRSIVEMEGIPFVQRRGAHENWWKDFWGDVFTETYGWTPFEDREDKLQESGYHKWEWVSGLELVALMLDYYDHSLDTDFLHKTLLPTAHEILAFFDQHYPTNANGQIVMYPSQALETWWDCTNPMPELAGLFGTTERLLALSADLTNDSQRNFWKTLRAKLPAIPTHTVDGHTALAPATRYADKRRPLHRKPFTLPRLLGAQLRLVRRRNRGFYGKVQIGRTIAAPTL